MQICIVNPPLNQAPSFVMHETTVCNDASIPANCLFRPVLQDALAPLGTNLAQMMTVNRESVTT